MDVDVAHEHEIEQHATTPSEDAERIGRHRAILQLAHGFAAGVQTPAPTALTAPSMIFGSKNRANQLETALSGAQSNRS